MITIKTVGDMNRVIAENLHKIKRNEYDAIVGIPRSGMIPASLIATHLQMPLADVEGFCDDRIYKRFHNKTKATRILLVDDTVNKGRAMDWAVQTIKERKPQTQITRFAVWHSAKTEPNMIDMTFGLCASPRVFQYNMWKHIRLPNWGFDFDGVFCRDPEKRENDDGPLYRNFLTKAETLFLPNRPIGHIVTARLEKYRPETEAWLKKHNIEYTGLHMMDFKTKQERMEAGGRGQWKGDKAKELGVEMFIESNPGQARKIAEVAKIPVWCTSTQEAFYGE